MTGWPVVQSCQIAAVRARMRCRTRAVLFQVELALERVVDRLDALARRAQQGPGVHQRVPGRLVVTVDDRLPGVTFCPRWPGLPVTVRPGRGRRRRTAPGSPSGST